MTAKPIYLDYQATTPLDPKVFEAMYPFYTEHFGNAHSDSHEYGLTAAAAILESRQSVAQLIGADAREIFFTSGATESNNLLLKGAAAAMARVNRPKIITVATEHMAVLEVLAALEREGHPVLILPTQHSGLVDLGELAAAIDDSVGLVSIMAVNNEIGTIQPLREIGGICRQRGVFFHSDAAQGAGKIAIDVRSMNIDLLSISGHKLYGPQGIGAAFIDRATVGRLQPLLTGGGQQGGIRAGTLPTALCVGLGAACRIASEKRSEERVQLELLRDRLLANLTQSKCQFAINGSLDSRWPGNINLSFDGVDAEALILDVRHDIAIASGSACTSASLNPSHVLLALGLGPERAESSIRIGIGRYTTANEIDRAALTIATAVHRLAPIRTALLVSEG